MWSHSKKNNVPIHEAVKFVLEKSNKKRNILSVGSGRGEEEKSLEERFGLTVVTVDPKKFTAAEIKEVNGKMPMYRFVREVPEKKSSMIMMIDWSFPSGPYTHNPDPLSKGDYDYHAIEEVRPRWLVIRWASCGAAGSDSLHSFLDKCGLKSQDPFLKKYEGKLKYGVLKHWQYVHGSGGGFTGYTVDVAVLKKGCKSNFTTIECQGVTKELPLKEITGGETLYGRPLYSMPEQMKKNTSQGI